MKNPPWAWWRKMARKKEKLLHVHRTARNWFPLCAIFLSLSAAGAASFVLKWPRRIADNSYPWETLKVRDEQGRWKGTLSVAQNPFSSQVEDGNRPRLVCHVLSARDLLYVRGSTKRRKRQMLFFPPLKFRPSLICECLRVFQFNLELWNNVTDLEDTFMC